MTCSNDAHKKMLRKCIVCAESELCASTTVTCNLEHEQHNDDCSCTMYLRLNETLLLQIHYRSQCLKRWLNQKFSVIKMQNIYRPSRANKMKLPMVDPNCK